MQKITDPEVQKPLLKFLSIIPSYAKIDGPKQEWEFLDKIDFVAWSEVDIILPLEEFYSLQSKYKEIYKQALDQGDGFTFYTKLRLTRLLALMVYFISIELKKEDYVKCLFLAYNIWRFEFEDSSSTYQKQLSQAISKLPLQVPITETFSAVKVKRLVGRYGFRLNTLIEPRSVEPYVKEPTDCEKFVEKVVRGGYKFNACVVANPFLDEVVRYYLSINKNLKSFDKFSLWYKFIYGDMKATLLQTLLQAEDIFFSIVLTFNNEFAKYKQKLTGLFLELYRNYPTYFQENPPKEDFQPLHIGYLLNGDKVRVDGLITSPDQEDVSIYYEGFIKVKLDQGDLIDFDDTELVLNGSVFAFEDNHLLVLEDIKKNYFTI